MNRQIAILIKFLIVLIATSSCKQKDTTSKAIKHVLILGNSIVGHGPAPQIGWHGAWGMAASVKDSDFVRLLQTEILIHDSTVTTTCENIAQIEVDPSKFEFSRLDSFKKPDMLIMRFGENVPEYAVDNGQFLSACKQVIKKLDAHKDKVVVIVNGIWPNAKANQALEQFAKDNNYIFVRNDDLFADSSNLAYGLFTDAGVAKHPSDKGMRSIKERIWQQIANYFPKK